MKNCKNWDVLKNLLNMNCFVYLVIQHAQNREAGGMFLGC